MNNNRDLLTLDPQRTRKLSQYWLLPGVVLAAIVATAIDGVYTVDQSEQAVLLVNGKIINTVNSGLHFKAPFISEVKKYSLHSQKQEYSKMSAYSRDQQTAEIRLSVSYKLLPDQAKSLYEQYGSLENLTQKLISPRVFQTVKTVFGKFNAVTAIQERERLNLEVYDAVIKSLASNGIVAIEAVNVENLDFSDIYERSIEERMLAEVEVQKLKQNLDREKVQADIVRTKAQAEADSRLAQAEAEAKAITLRGQAEADSILAKANAMKENAQLVELIKAEKWNGQLPQTMLPTQALPIIGTRPE